MRNRGIVIVVSAIIIVLMMPRVSLAIAAGSINDYADVISSSGEVSIQNEIEDCYNKSGVSVTIIVDNTLGVQSIEEYANNTFNNNNLGGNNNRGILLAVFIDDGDVRIEVSDSVVSVLNDSRTGRILDDYFIPYARSDMEKAIIETTAAISKECINRANGMEAAAQPTREVLVDQKSGAVGAINSMIEALMAIVVLIVVIVLIILFIRVTGPIRTRGYGRVYGRGYYRPRYQRPHHPHRNMRPRRGPHMTYSSRGSANNGRFTGSNNRGSVNTGSTRSFTGSSNKSSSPGGKSSGGGSSRKF